MVLAALPDPEPVVLDVGLATAGVCQKPNVVGRQWTRPGLLSAVLVGLPFSRYSSVGLAVYRICILRFHSHVDRVCAVVWITCNWLYAATQDFEALRHVALWMRKRVTSVGTVASPDTKTSESICKRSKGIHFIETLRLTLSRNRLRSARTILRRPPVINPSAFSWPSKIVTVSRVLPIRLASS